MAGKNDFTYIEEISKLRHTCKKLDTIYTSRCPICGEMAEYEKQSQSGRIRWKCKTCNKGFEASFFVDW